MSYDTLWDAALAYACGVDAALAFPHPQTASTEPFPNQDALQQVLLHWDEMDTDTQSRMINFLYGLAVALPGKAQLTFPKFDTDSPLRTLYPNRAALEPVLAVIDHLDALQQNCDALPEGDFQLVKAEGDILHFTRTGPTEILDAVFNRGPHFYLATIDEKSTQVNPYGFTLTVREHGHNANHSYYDFR